MGKIKIITKSYTSVASGEGSGIIDSDVIFDNYGIPYIPAKRIKGLLRDSAEDVLAFSGFSPKNNLIEEIFGNEIIQGKCLFENVYIENYNDIKRELECLLQKNEYKNILTRTNILSYYTTILQQTAIDENGIAKEHSLRTIRAIKPDIEFYGYIDDSRLSKSAKALLYLAIKNLRRLGLNRNVGWGLVDCIPDLNGINDANVLSFLLKESINEEKNISKNYHANIDKDKIKNEQIKSCYIKIKTESPVLISERSGDLNTVDTRLYIPGTTVRGILANELIKKLDLNSQNAHYNDLFKTCFIDDLLLVNFALPLKNNKTFFPIPLNFQSEKGNDNDIYDIFSNNNNKTNTRSKSVFVSDIIEEDDEITIEKISIKTRSYFHASRDKRKGTNTNGAIFYYDSIEPGNEFISIISAPESILNKIKEILGTSFECRIGRSKTSQYGKVKVEISDKIDLNETEKDFCRENEITLYAVTPVILFDQYGNSTPSITLLKEYLSTYFQTNFEITNQISKVTKVDFFNNQWGHKSSTYRAFSEGSAFKLKFESTINDNLNAKIIELEKIGIGEFTSLVYGKLKFTKIYDEKIKLKDNKEDDKNNQVDISKIKPLLENILERLYIEKVEYIGWKDVKELKGKLSASLCGRMIEALKKFDTHEKFKNEFLENSDMGIKDKPAEEKLKDAYILNKLNGNLKTDYKELKRLNDISNEIKYSPNMDKLYRHYWIAFFKHARLIAKKN
jgi:CRISPR-associated protein Csx10